MSQFTDAPILDADQHMYETPDAITKHLPERFKHKIQFVKVGRHDRVAINNKITDYMPNPTFERVAGPGAHEPFYARNNPEGLSLNELSKRGAMDSIPAFREPDARLKVMDEHGVDQALVYPTLAHLVEHAAAGDPDLTVAVIHALNEWMLETWGYVRDNRMFMTPVITCALVDEARRELEYVLDKGAKVILIKPAPAYGRFGWRSPALPEFDPFWNDVQSANVPVVMHGSQPPLQEYVDMFEPQSTSNFFAKSAFKHTVLGHREIADMLTSLVCHGTFTRFPKLRVASIENGSSWIRPLLEELENTYEQMPQEFDEHPVEVIRRNCWVSPFWEGSVADVVEQLGWDKVMFGSDYPHPEGLEEPKKFYQYTEDMDEQRARDFMGDNARRFLGVPVMNPNPVAAVGASQ